MADETKTWSGLRGADAGHAVSLHAGDAGSPVTEALGELICNARRMRDGGGSFQVEMETPSIRIEADEDSSLAAGQERSEIEAATQQPGIPQSELRIPHSTELFSLAARAAVARTADADETPALPGLSSLAAIAAPSEPAQIAGTPVQVKGEEVVMEVGDRRYRVRGLQKNLSHGQMKVTVYATRDEALHVDALNLCSAYQRITFSKQASAELGVKDEVIKRDLGKLLLGLEELQESQIRQAMEPKQKTPMLTDDETRAALELLGEPRLLDRVLADFERSGVVGEEINKLICYVAAVSRKMDEPLAVIIQSSTSAGKTSLMEAVLQFCPEEERVKYTAMTGQALFYMSDADLRHKILAIVEEEGAERASYALKLLQSEGELTIASTGKDATTGKLVTHEYRVEGPVMIMLTTTAIELDEELQNRCLVLTVDEDREQTRAIHRLQREMKTLDGLWAKEERKQIIKLHQDAQRLLRPLQVVNPHARKLTFLDRKTRMRRDHVKYLTLIDAIALLHQYQRRIRTDSRNGTTKQYIEVTADDIEVANRLANEVLGHSLDELPPQTRRFLKLLYEMVRERCQKLKMEQCDYRFKQREVRDYTGWSDFQVKSHLRKLVEMEYVVAHRVGATQGFVYELVYQGEGEEGERFMLGLIDVEKLREEQRNRSEAHNYGGDREHEKEGREH